MEKLKFHHIGIATENIEEAIKEMSTFFEITHISDIVFDEKQNASLCMLTIADGTKIELISGGQVERLVRKRQFLYHICYETDDIQAQIKQFEEMGYMLVSDAKEAILFNMKKVAFMMTNMGLIELVEK